MAFVTRRLRKVKPRVLEATKDGKSIKLHKQCFVKVIVQDKVQPHRFVAPAGKGYSEDDIDDIREKCVDYLDKRFPHFEFKEVQIAANAFNYIAIELRGGQSTEEFMNDQSKRFDPEAFVASVRAAKGGVAAASTADGGSAAVSTGDKPDNEGSGPTTNGTECATEDRSVAGEPPAGADAAANRQEAAAGCDSEGGVQESGAQDCGTSTATGHSIGTPEPAT